MISPGPDSKLYPINKLAIILDLLAEESVPAELALSGTGLAPSAVSPRTRVSLNQVLECYRNALRLSRDPHFAYDVGLRFHVSTYGMYGFAMLSSTNFRHTLRFAIRYHALATPFAKLAFQETDDRGIITIEPAPYPTIDGDLYRYIVELQWGNATSLLRDVMGPSFGPLAVHAAFDGRASPSDYPAVVGCPVLFGQEENRFIFDAGWLDRPAEFGNRVTYAMVVKMCDDLLAELELREGWAGKVRRCLMASLPALNSFEDIANELDISPRSLRRRLSEENASYRKLAEEVRTEMAIKYLRETDLSTDEVAAALGFNEAANFRHAFRRWTKAAPAKFRNMRRPGPRPTP
jgi:AraC-like DNA-binding protein